MSAPVETVESVPFHSAPNGTVLEMVNRQGETIRVEIVGPVENARYGDREVKLLRCPMLDMNTAHVMYIANPGPRRVPGDGDVEASDGILTAGTHVHLKVKADKQTGVWFIVVTVAVATP